MDHVAPDRPSSSAPEDGAPLRGKPAALHEADAGEQQAPFSAETERARHAQQRWAQVPINERLRRVRAFRHELVDASRRICKTIAGDVGKRYDETLVAEVLPLAQECRFLEANARRILRPRKSPLRTRPILLWGQRDVTFRRPRGVVAVIGTWNLPMAINVVPILHALTAGNAVLFKPSEVAPRTGELIADLIARAGFPDGLFQLLPASRDAGPQLAEADIDHVAFTGSSTTGRVLASTLGRRLVTSTLELSGCDLLLLLEDGNVPLAARGAWFGATANAGQACVGTRRAFVPRSLLEPFLDALVPLVECAAPVPLILSAQVKLADRLIADALGHGARLIRREGVEPADGHVQPAALVQPAPDTLACREAYFVPLLTVVPYDTVEQALAWDAECSYSLAASVFTADVARARTVATRLRCGVVHVNDVIIPMAHPATSFGGSGASGWGRTKGVEGLLEMTVPQVVSAVSGSFRPHFDTLGTHWFFDPDSFEALIKLFHARSLRDKFGAARHLAGQVLGTRQRGPSDRFRDSQ
ncbi:MAG: aldehyde dehydrogenase family protein [Candidatus Hydrogenedentes bacterium]|nr:aldehyde dehydrogenase family protein [Candidatus Hydrogenedentota bacterium]